MIIAYIDHNKLFGKTTSEFFPLSSLPVIGEELVFDHSITDMRDRAINLSAQVLNNNLWATELKELNLLKLESVFGNIYLRLIPKYNLRLLSYVKGSLTFKEINTLFLPELREIDCIITEDVDEIDLPKLEKCNVIYAGNCKKIATQAKCIILCSEDTNCDCDNAIIYRGLDYRLKDNKIYQIKEQQKEEDYTITVLEDIENQEMLYCLETDYFHREYGASKEEVVTNYKLFKGEINADSVTE